VIIVPSLGYEPTLLRFKSQFRDHMLYAQVLVVCTLCQAWACKLGFRRFKTHFCKSYDVCTSAGCVHIVPSLGI
jgi:hypothetical protein